MKREQTEAMKKVLKEFSRCELCGSPRALEAHHIIPIAFGGEDVEDNILCLCHKCHGLLTPTSVLTQHAIRKKKWEIDFWKHFNELSEAGERYDAIDVFDYLKDNVFPLFRSVGA